MATRFILAVHCHQPIGNFPWVFEEAYETAYRPFLEVLERHPKVPFAAHYSGPLLSWFERERPDFLKTLRGMAARGQVEVLGGGFYEPILTLIPEADALGQLMKMKATLQRLKLVEKSGPAGGWLTERVWEPHVPSLLAAAGVGYTIVDDHHLECAGVPEEQRFGYHLTEDRGNTIAIFPSSKTLRYGVPFKPVSEVMEALRALQSDRPRAVVLADDGEKFGLWPGTFRWVYEEGWLENFVSQIEKNSSWLIPTTFSRFLKESPPLGKVYLPCASYQEMAEWSGGNFRNFLLKYPEAETMYQKMLWVSKRLEDAGRGTRFLSQACQHLYMAQGNDPYWHGVFGGIYLRHLRRSAFSHLLQAERLIDAHEPRGVSWTQAQEQAGGTVRLRSKGLSLLVDSSRGAELLELGDKERCLNVLDTVTRRPEPYHKKVQMQQEVVFAAAGSSPATIHDRSEASWAAVDTIVYDPHRRAGLIDHAFGLTSSVQEFASGAAAELGDFVETPYKTRLRRSKNQAAAVFSREGCVRMEGVDCPLQMTKTIALSGKNSTLTVTHQLVNASARRLVFLFGSEMNLALKDAHVNRVGEAQGVQRFSVIDPALEVSVLWSLSQPARLWYFPLETLSDSERGLERTYQGVNVTFLWPIDLASNGRWSVMQELTVDSSHAVTEEK